LVLRDDTDEPEIMRDNRCLKTLGTWVQLIRLASFVRGERLVHLLAPGVASVLYARQDRLVSGFMDERGQTHLYAAGEVMETRRMTTATITAV
jgi:hypothetical protein